MVQMQHSKRILSACVVLLATTMVAIADNDDTTRDCYSIGPDVVCRFWDTHDYGSVGDISAFSMGTDACNIGDEVLNWEADNENHPVISTSVYRLKDNRFEQVGGSANYDTDLVIYDGADWVVGKRDIMAAQNYSLN